MSKNADSGTSSASLPLAYVLSPSDGPETQLISYKLNGRNYNTWSQAMQTALRAKNKLGSIEGRVKQPAEGESYHDLWDRKSVLEYYSKLNSLSDELDLYLDLPACTCDASVRIAAQKEKEKPKSQSTPGIVTLILVPTEAISSLSVDRSVTFVGEMDIIEQLATSFTDIHTPISPINEVQKGICRASCDMEEKQGFVHPLFLRRREMVASVSNPSIQGNRGPYKISSITGARYFLSIVDDFSRGVWVYLLRDKSEAHGFLINLCKLVKNQFDRTVKTVRSDNGSEFMSRVVQDYFFDNGIIHQTSCIDTLQQNGLVEPEPSRPHSLAPPDSLVTLPGPALTGLVPAQPASSSDEPALHPSSDPAKSLPNPTPATEPNISSEQPANIIACSKPLRNIRTLNWLNDFVSHTARCLDYPPSQSPTPSHSPGMSHPLEHYLTYSDIDATPVSFLAAIDSDTEPRTYSEANKDPRWRLAMAEEIRALEDNDTWAI
ncbi:hypothetical protein CRG98_023963 [Punica granatum]|uniref:Integrase catalytic domain-containing protein n=1 Tax=Punica granatum TaxID=22663 RepID=A0A2I0JHD2_PUNGR|nr:hypothetical protein CRG98_023963 [Punica granatum]